MSCRRAPVRARLAGVGFIACAIAAHAQERSAPARPGAAPSAAASAAATTSPSVTAPDNAPTNSVEIVVVGEGSELEAIRRAVAPHDFGEASATWRVQPKFERRTLLDAPAPASASVRAFIVPFPGRADLYFADRAGERFLVREVQLPNGLDAVGREAVSQVLALSVVALLEDHAAGISRSEAQRLFAPPEPEPVEPTPPAAEPGPSARAVSVSAGAFYAAKAYGDGVALVHGPGVKLAFISSGESSHSALWASAQYELPQSYRAADVGVKWSTALFRGGVEWSHALPGTPLYAGLRLGLGADLIDFSPRLGDAGSVFVLTAARQSTVAVFTPAFELALPLGERWSVTADFYADCYPTQVAFGLERDGTPERVLSPWRVRPGLALGLMLR